MRFKILNLIRCKNLIIIILVQLLIKYALLEPFGVQTSLNLLGMLCLTCATICIAAAGYIINDINDIKTDLINKPNKIIIGSSISKKSAYYLFVFFNIIGVGLGFYLSYILNKTAFFSIFIFISITLYIYAIYLKRTILVGNILISILVAFSIIIVGVFELLPSITSYNQQTHSFFFKVILDYAWFAFIINLLREIVKDIEDLNGDYNSGMQTLPILLGRERTKNILSFLNFIPLAAIIHHITTNLYKQPVVVAYYLLFIVAPLLYICIKTFSAKTKKDFNHLSNMYKIVMVFGILSLLLFKYVILK